MDNIDVLINWIVFLFSINISLMIGFSAIGKNIKEITKKLSIITFSIAIAVYMLMGLIPFNIFSLLVWVILIVVIKYVIGFSFEFTATGVLTSFIAYNVINILVEHITTIFNCSEWKNLIYIVVFLLLGIISYFFKLRIFEENWEDLINFKRNREDKKHLSMALIIIILIVLSFWCIFISGNIEVLSLKLNVYQIIFMLLVIILFFILIRSLILYELAKTEIKLNKINQEHLLSFMHTVRSQRHDFNFHLHAIIGMLDNDDVKECKGYIHNLLESVQLTNEVLPVYHPAISSLLNGFKETAAKKGFKLETLIYYDLHNVPCTVNEINIILGNLIQNALDEVVQHFDDKESIKVMILKRSGNAVIKVSNKVDASRINIKNIFKLGYSTKNQHEGIGLCTVNKIVTKYEGVIYPEIEEDIISFIVQIPILRNDKI